MPQPAVINRFVSEYHFLSNFSLSPLIFCIEDEDQPRWARTVEHAFQAFKTTDPTHQRLILAAQGPREAKALAGPRGIITLRDGWDGMRLSVMYRLLKAKFAPHHDIAAQLKATGNAILIEGNTWHDDYWGMCIDGKMGPTFNGMQGFNWLGHLLMLVRSELML